MSIIRYNRSIWHLKKSQKCISWNNVKTASILPSYLQKYNFDNFCNFVTSHFYRLLSDGQSCNRTTRRFYVRANLQSLLLVLIYTRISIDINITRMKRKTQKRYLQSVLNDATTEKKSTIRNLSTLTHDLKQQLRSRTTWMKFQLICFAVNRTLEYEKKTIVNRHNRKLHTNTCAIKTLSWRTRIYSIDVGKVYSPVRDGFPAPGDGIFLPRDRIPVPWDEKSIPRNGLFPWIDFSPNENPINHYSKE